MLSIYMFECRCACDDLLVMMNINSDCANGRVEPDTVDVHANWRNGRGSLHCSRAAVPKSQLSPPFRRCLARQYLGYLLAL